MKERMKTEAAVTQYMFSKASQKKIPLSGTFELTSICNFSCRMCYVRKTAKEVAQSQRGQMTCEKWLELAEQLRREGMLYLLLTGGEPFLWPDFWKLYESLCEMGFLISVNTNGSMLNEEIVQRLKKNPPTRINLTLYGVSNETYKELCQVENMFTRVSANIELLIKAGIPLKLSCSLTPYNAEELEEIAAYAKQRNLMLEIASYMFPPVRRDATLIGKNERFTPDEAARYSLKSYGLQYGEENYIRHLKRIVNKNEVTAGICESCREFVDGKMRCRAGKSVFWITWDGWLTPCGMLNEPRVDVQNKDFRTCWDELVQESKKIRLSGKCLSCANREICHSCAAIAAAESGVTEGIPDYLCKTIEAMKKIAEEQLKIHKNKEGK